MAGNLTDMTWWEYVRHVAGTDVQTAIADRTGIAQATVSRWKLRRQAVDATNAVIVARAFGRPAVEALVVAGFLKPEDVDAQVTITRHEDPSDEQLLELLRRRLQRDHEVTRDDDATATSPAGGSPATDDLAHRRRQSIAERIAADEQPAAAREGDVPPNG